MSMSGKRLFRLPTISLTVFCILLNFGLAQLMLYFKIPLFLDALGTLLAAALGGFLPAMFVGFLSNCLLSLYDPITLYYGVLSVLIGLVATWIAHRGWFESFWKTLLGGFLFSIIGGFGGSLMTWMLYGLDLGSGISAPFATALHTTLQLDAFWAQLLADMMIDLVDKMIVVLAAYCILRFMPRRLKGWLKPDFAPDSHKNEAGSDNSYGIVRRAHSLGHRITAVSILTTCLIACTTVGIGFGIYIHTMDAKYTRTAQSVVGMMKYAINPNHINQYLTDASLKPEYAQTEAELQKIRSCMPDIRFMYVYKVTDNGCQVIFDLDTQDVPAGQLGEIVPIEEAFLPYVNDLKAGRNIKPIISNGIYGWLLSVYAPLFDDNGTCVGYAAADVSMREVISDRYIYVIRVISLLFGSSIIIVAFFLWYIERKISEPLNALTQATGKIAYDSEEKRQKNTEQLQALNIHTGDEIENLYHAIVKTTGDVTEYINEVHIANTELREKSQTIIKLQQNMVISFAVLAENRDENTGDHIRRTSAYVKTIAAAMAREGKHTELLTPAYIETIEKSAPLHDIGKIRIPDAILNKPGRLTPEEFEIMKTHTTIGREVLSGVLNGIDRDTNLSQAIDMATFHHERWDGTGYPCGLAGEDIPICARIMAVADVFDALLSKRCYKEAIPFDEAVSDMQADSGTHFDPDVIDTFLHILPELRSLSES